MASRATTGRAIAIVAGLALAGLAAFLIWRYVDAADQRARDDATLVDVLVATQGIPAGTTAEEAVSQQFITSDVFLLDSLPDTALTSVQQIAGQTALAGIPEGSLLVSDQWGEPSLGSSAFVVPDGDVAMSLQVGIPQGLSGYLAPEDRVGIIAHINAASTTSNMVGPDGNPVETTDVGEASQTRSEFVVREASVLAIGRRVITADDDGNPQGEVQQTEQVLVTLAVSPEDAEKLVFASNEGLLYLTLLPEPGDVGNTTGRTFDDLFAE